MQSPGDGEVSAEEASTNEIAKTRREDRYMMMKRASGEERESVVTGYELIGVARPTPGPIIK